MAKIFLSYKFYDNQVDQSLDRRYWAENTWEATGRGYANKIEEIIGRENTYKGESDGEPLRGKTESQIWDILKPKLHDSSVTIVAISRGMKDLHVAEAEQWIPQEIRYSLYEVERGGRTSATNALLGVIIPDRNGGYEYIYGKSTCPHCANIRLIDNINNRYLYNILKGNIFNRKGDNGQTCVGAYCGTTIYDGDHSYLHLVTFDDFVTNHSSHIDKSLSIKESGSLYNIEKTI